jgi:hypothetical protein
VRRSENPKSNADHRHQWRITSSLFIFIERNNVDFEKVKARIKEAFEENPMATVAVGALAVTALAKLLGAYSNLRRDKVWAREVARREQLRR